MSDPITGITDEPDVKNMYGEPEEREEREYDPARAERMERHMDFLAELRRSQIMRGAE